MAIDMTEKLTGVKKTIVMDIRAKAGADPNRITVEYDFSDVSVGDVVDWAVHASGLRVAFQNHVRPKGEAHLKGLTGQTVEFKVRPAGTRTPGEISHAELLARVLGAERFKEQLEAFEGDVEALWHAFFEQAKAMHIGR